MLLLRSLLSNFFIIIYTKILIIMIYYIFLVTVKITQSYFQYLIFNLTPAGIPTTKEADRLLCLDTFFSAPYSIMPPKVPILKIITLY